MILRKPYAFFIKYFRLINLAMAVLMAILIYRTGIIGKFLTDYINDYATASSGFVISDYINFYSFLITLLIIILTIVVMSVLIFKKKPKKLYIFNLILYFGIIILYGIDYSIMRGINEALLDIRVSKAIRDITFIALALQVVSFALTIIRATGFDIKGFDFNTDLQQLDIETKDNEEFEVSVEVDRNKVKRDIRKSLRNIKYVYFENKFIINMIVLIVIIIVGFIVFINIGIYRANYKEDKPFQASGVIANVRDTYVTKTDETGNDIVPADKVLVVVKFDIRKLVADENKILNTGITTLRIGNASYSQVTNYNDGLNDIGTVYVDQKLSSHFTSYLLVFEIPSDSVNKAMSLKFNDQVSYVKGEIGAKSIYVKLDPQNLTDKKAEKSAEFGEELTFDGSILGTSIFKINRFSIGNKFKVDYKFCSTKDKCGTSYEYVTPTATGNYPKTLMRIEGSFAVDESKNLSNADDIYYFLNSFGTIHYKVNGEWFSHKINSKLVKPKLGSENTVSYIEVNLSVEQATEIYLTFSVRDYSYKYVLK